MKTVISAAPTFSSVNNSYIHPHENMVLECESCLSLMTKSSTICQLSESFFFLPEEISYSVTSLACIFAAFRESNHHFLFPYSTVYINVTEDFPENMLTRKTSFVSSRNDFFTAAAAIKFQFLSKSP